MIGSYIHTIQVNTHLHYARYARVIEYSNHAVIIQINDLFYWIDFHQIIIDKPVHVLALAMLQMLSNKVHHLYHEIYVQ